MTAVYTAVTKEETGDAAVLVNISQRLGGALGTIGVAITLTVYASNSSSSQENFVSAFGLLTLLALGALCSACYLLHQKPQPN